MFRFVPVLLAPLALYAALWIVSGGMMEQRLSALLITIPMPSGEAWRISWGAAFNVIAALCLFLEVVRSANPNTGAIGENMVSALLLAACVVVFLLVRGFATNEFFLIMVFLLLDFVADGTIMVFTARRTIDVGR